VANLTWGHVVLIGGVATVGFTLVSYWWSGVMSRKGWSWQVKPKAPPRKPDAPPASTQAAASPPPAAGAPKAPKK
jgi:hypothetical protein